MTDPIDNKINELEERIKGLEENIGFIKELLSHLHQQFQAFRSDIEQRR